MRIALAGAILVVHGNEGAVGNGRANPVGFADAAPVPGNGRAPRVLSRTLQGKGKRGSTGVHFNFGTA